MLIYLYQGKKLTTASTTYCYDYLYFQYKVSALAYTYVVRTPKESKEYMSLFICTTPGSSRLLLMFMRLFTVTFQFQFNSIHGILFGFVLFFIVPLLLCCPSFLLLFYCKFHVIFLLSLLYVLFTLFYTQLHTQVRTIHTFVCV